MEKKTYPYGFKIWMNNLSQVGNKMKIWDIFPPENHKVLCWDAWLNYFLIGLSPLNAILKDIKEGGE